MRKYLEKKEADPQKITPEAVRKNKKPEKRNTTPGEKMFSRVFKSYRPQNCWKNVGCILFFVGFSVGRPSLLSGLY
jgi:hypothetical protein